MILSIINNKSFNSYHPGYHNAFARGIWKYIVIMFQAHTDFCQGRHVVIRRFFYVIRGYIWQIFKLKSLLCNFFFFFFFFKYSSVHFWFSILDRRHQKITKLFVFLITIPTITRMNETIGQSIIFKVCAFEFTFTTLFPIVMKMCNY